ncbi:MAG: 3'(2'),5'-bisphosphate nucleotidase CysQ [Rhizobiales bacterium]|nr:3'(2'),5'-bisphosphate nucleotidase CysQ [Hyphomicrobiales bacterium]
MPPLPASDSTLVSLIDAALAGARAVMAVYATDFAVERKADDSPVSEADRNAEEAIVARLGAAFPDTPIVAEEAAADGRTPATGKRFFLVDPLDGTKEFISRNGEFTVNIGLIEDGAPVAGVVLAPALGSAYAGSAVGAWKGRTDEALDEVRDWAAMRARSAGPAPVAVASRSHSNPATEEALARANAGERRSIGSSLKFCLVAEAAADFYPRLGPTMEWDTAAGDAVLRAAGGGVVTLDGTPLIYGKTGVPGMREFENPYFLAAGDSILLKRFGPTKAA